MLRSLRRFRTSISPVTAGIFALGLLVGTVDSPDLHGGEAPDGGAQVHQETHHGHAHGAHPEAAEVPAPPAPAEDHTGHGCDLCLCFAATGTCSAPALTTEIAPPADVPVILTRLLAAPTAPPGGSPPYDIFHPPQG